MWFKPLILQVHFCRLVWPSGSSTVICFGAAICKYIREQLGHLFHLCNVLNSLVKLELECFFSFTRRKERKGRNWGKVFVAGGFFPLSLAEVSENVLKSRSCCAIGAGNKAVPIPGHPNAVSLHELLCCAGCPVSWPKIKRTFQVETLWQTFKEEFSFLWTTWQFCQISLLLKKNGNILTIR